MKTTKAIRSIAAITIVSFSIIVIPCTRSSPSPAEASAPDSAFVIPKSLVASELQAALGDGSKFNIDDRQGDRHVHMAFSGLLVSSGDVTVARSADGISVTTTDDLRIEATVTGHNADQKTAPASKLTVSISTLTARIAPGQKAVELKIPVEIETKSFFVPFTDAKNKKVLGHRTTTRAWAGPRPFKVKLIWTINVAAPDDGKQVTIRLVDWSPSDAQQVIPIGGWVRLPALLRDFNPDLAGEVKPLNAENVKISVKDFGDRTISNPVAHLLNGLKQSEYTFHNQD